MHGHRKKPLSSNRDEGGFFGFFFTIGDFIMEERASAMQEVAYRFPVGATQHPLEMSDERFFLDASGLSYATDDLESLHEPYKNEWIVNNIPMGYKSILILERLVFIRCGGILQENEPTRSARVAANFIRPETGRYCIYSNQPIPYPKYNAVQYKLSKNGERGYNDTTWSSKEDAVEYALRASEGNYADLLIVARVLCYENWH
jgi:hypothetical protein